MADNYSLFQHSLWGRRFGIGRTAGQLIVDGMILSATQLAGLPATGGNTYFVSSVTGASGNAGTSAQFPLLTIAAAYALTTADNGDLIVCLPGHKETIIAAGGITLAKSGINILGLGEGADRPTLTFSTSTAATLLITGANQKILNFVGICGINGLVAPIAVQASDVAIQMEWHEGATSATQSVRVVLGTAAADRLRLDLKFIGFTSGGTAPVNCVRLVGSDDVRMWIDFYGIASTAIVEFLTTACTNVAVNGYFYNSGTTNFSLNVVDTATGSTWVVQGFDGGAGLSFDGGSGKAVAGNDPSTVIATLAVPSLDAATNTNERDVIGNKTDTAIYAGSATGSLAAYLKGSANVQDGVAVRATAVLANGNTLFTIAGGSIQIMELMAICITANDATATTLQFSSSPTVGSATTISGASASLTSATAGTTVLLTPTALSTAPVISAASAGGVQLGLVAQNHIIVNAGTITSVIGTGPSTGTWSFVMRYRPLSKGVTVV